jgi:hypothetical protein
VEKDVRDWGEEERSMALEIQWATLREVAGNKQFKLYNRRWLTDLTARKERLTFILVAS